MADKNEANLGGESTDRRKFLAGVAAATAATVAAGASEAYAAPIEDAGKKTERKTVAVAEGVLHKTHGEVTEIEIMDNYRIEIESNMVEVVQQVTDEDTGRPFVRLEIKDGAVVRGQSSKGKFEWRPKTSNFVKQYDLPFAMATNGPSKVGGEFPLGSVDTQTALLTGEQENTVFTFGALTPVANRTRSVFNTCAVYTQNLYGIFCDQYIGDINFPDD
ncbi:MAG: hypothetical protein AABP62_24945 [Planctomycetota bacterium]